MTPHLADTPVLQTERLTLRAPELQDFEPAAAFLRSARAGFVGGPIESRREAWRSFSSLIGHWAMRGFGMFVMERRTDSAPLGIVGPLFPETWPEREFGWSVWSVEAEGQGYAFEAMREVRRHTFEVLGWDTAVSYIDPDNTRSIALAERLGAVRDAAAEGLDPEDLVYRHRPEAA